MHETVMVPGGPPYYVLAHFHGFAAVLGVAIWVGFAWFLSGGGNDLKNDRIAQLYGYSVCLVSIITLLLTLPAFVSTLLIRNDETLKAYGAASVRSFDAYKATRDRLESEMDRKPAKVKSDDELRAEFEAVRADRMASAQEQRTSQLVSLGISIALAAILLITHWRWLRGREARAQATVA